MNLLTKQKYNHRCRKQTYSYQRGQWGERNWEIEIDIYYTPYYWKRHWHPTPVLLPGKSHGRRAWWAAVHGVAKSRTRLSDFTFTFHFHALEKEMATHSSVLAWRIPGTGEPGGLPSMGRTESDTTEAT